MLSPLIQYHLKIWIVAGEAGQTGLNAQHHVAEEEERASGKWQNNLKRVVYNATNITKEAPIVTKKSVQVMEE